MVEDPCSSTLNCICMIEGCQRCYSNWIEENRSVAQVYGCEGRVEFLIIAESPPCHHGRGFAPYVYRIERESELLKNTGLLYPIMEAMKAAGMLEAVPLKKKDCLHQLAEQRIFVMDICEYPVNKMPSFVRQKAVSLDIEALSTRLRELESAGNIVTAIERSEDEILEAIDKAGLTGFVRDSLPFPGRPASQKIFIERLTYVFKGLQKE